METKLTIGERLKDLRVERDLNQKVVESQAGIPSSTLSTYENDTVGNVNVAAIIKLAEFYDVQPEYLLCLTDNKKTPRCKYSGLASERWYGGYSVEGQGTEPPAAL